VEGNLLLDRIYGAHVHHISTFEGTLEETDEQRVRTLQVELRAAGKRPYVIPLGGSNALGTLGYTLAVAELEEQLSGAGAPVSRLYYASGSRGTQAGLVLGSKLLGTATEVYGIAVSGGGNEKNERACRLIREAADLLKLTSNTSHDDLITDDHFIGTGYGAPTPECLEAIAIVARTEAILLDPCYTGKAMAGLIAHVRRGVIPPQHTIVFLHTGGIPALFTNEFVRQFAPYLEQAG
jgi:1-aminocyclopropane-1-carboxylate deaminase/D-cysteine desulfhydrase-like pyridoxal-dependent ACC family enzyme